MAFICLWIAFNAAYAQDLGDGANGGTSEGQAFRNFMADVCALDKGKALSALVWQVFPGPIRLLLDNQYVFQPFGDALNTPRSDGSNPDHLREAFGDARQRVHRALVQQDTERVLCEVFVRLYTLRNQLMHGGAYLEQLGQPRPGARWPGAAGAGVAGDAGRDDGLPSAVRGTAVLPGGGGLIYDIHIIYEKNHEQNPGRICPKPRCKRWRPWCKWGPPTEHRLKANGHNAATPS